MTTFTINQENQIVAFATQEEAAAATQTPFDSFTNQQELAELAVAWPADRLVATWNNLPGVTPVEKFKDRKTALTRIWKRLQQSDASSLPKAEQKAKGGARAAKGAPAKAKSTKKTTVAKNAPKGKEGHQGEGRRRASRGQQGRHGRRAAPAEERRHSERDRGEDEMAAAHRQGFYCRRHEEGRIRGRVLQARRRGAELSHQPLAIGCILLARPAPAAAGFLAFVGDTFPKVGLIRPISARYPVGLSLRVSARILVSRLAS
jgi:hypothetical protein